jgi:biotin synthase
LLLRFESSNPNIEKRAASRIEHLKKAYELGYLIITGGLIGLPGQTVEDQLNDILLAKELHAEMFTFGPFLPHPDTPFAKFPPPTVDQVMKTLAVARIADPKNAKILVTTGFETLDTAAREKGLMAGANSVMLNVTPEKFRKKYSIYPNRAHDNEPIQRQIDTTLNILRNIGRAPTDLGVTLPHN